MSQPKFKINRDLYPFTSRFMRMKNGAEVHYLDEGEGNTTFLMLHGNPTWSFVYRKLVQGLLSNYRCVVPDYLGFGLSVVPPGFDFAAQSQYEVMAEFVERLELKNVILVGQDWGGLIGFALAARYPDLIKGVVIGNTWAWPFLLNASHFWQDDQGETAVKEIKAWLIQAEQSVKSNIANSDAAPAAF